MNQRKGKCMRFDCSRWEGEKKKERKKERERKREEQEESTNKQVTRNKHFKHSHQVEEYANAPV